MDPNFRERQGYYGNDRDTQPDIGHHQQQLQQQQQQQQQQLIPHYAPQLSHHSALLPPHLQQHPLHHSQAAFVLDQAEQMRTREEFTRRHSASSILQQMHPESVQIISNSNVSHDHRGHHQQQFSDQAHPHLAHLSPTSRDPFTQGNASQPDPLHRTHSDDQAFISQEPSEGDSVKQDHGEITPGEGERLEIAEVESQVLSSQPTQHPRPPARADQNAPKKRAVRLALAETQQLLQQQQNKNANAEQNNVAPPIAAANIWKPDLPIGLAHIFSTDGKKISGVRSERALEKGARFGPFNGKLMDEDVGSLRDSSWELCLRGKVYLYVDGQSKSHNNWMAFVQCARSEEEQNLEAFQSYGDIYFRTMKVVDPGSELRVFYSEEYASHIGFKTKLNELNYNKESESFPCHACERTYPTAKRLLRHAKMSHDPDRASEMRAVPKWEPRIAGDSAENENSAQPQKPAPVPAPVKRTMLPSNANVGAVDERFICTTCGKNFPTRGRLAAHETFHEYSTEHTCPICGEGQMNSHILAKHMVTHKAKPFKCQTCGNAFATRNMLSRHERLSHTLSHSCRVCAMQFAKKRACSRHEKEHPEWRNYKRVPSVSRRKKKKKVAMHDQEADDDDLQKGEIFMDFAHETDDDMDNQDDETNPNLPRDMLGKRINYYERPRPYKCRFCSKRYLSKKAKLDHEAEAHTKKCDFKCTHCPLVFATEMRYVEHVKRHVENRPFQCELCPKSFASESALRNHGGEHTGLKPVKCDMCGKGFRTRHFMTAHKRRMHKVQQMRFACSYCNKPFSDKGNMIKHERRHKGIRPFVCLTCGKGFTSKFCLTSHTYTHTNEKRFGCPFCEHKFTLNQHLTNHIYREHTSKKSGIEEEDDPQAELQQQQQQP